MPIVSETLIEALESAGVNTVFGIPSIHNIGFYNALKKHPSIKHILCRQEAAGTHMADGYARAGKGPGVIISSTGPGAGYTVGPLMEAYWSSSPVLMLTSNIKSKKIGKGIGTLHEIQDQNEIFRNITKNQICLRPGDDVLLKAKAGISSALSGRPGPVYMEVPVDMWDQEAGGTRTASDSEPDQEMNQGLDQGSDQEMDKEMDLKVFKAKEMLTGAERPLIVTGLGALHAGLGQEILHLSEALNAPVVTSAGAKGIMPEDHPLSFGLVTRTGSVREMIQSADVVLAIGTRLREADFVRRGLNFNRLIHMEWDEKWINLNFEAELPLAGNVGEMARFLLKKILEDQEKDNQSWSASLKSEVEKETGEIAKNEVELEYLQAIEEALPKEGCLVADNTLLGYWSEYFYSSLAPGGYMAAKGSSIIGFSLPAAIGLKVAKPEMPVISLSGDGGFMYGAQELATCLRHGIGFPAIVVNDGAFGIIDFLQQMTYKAGYETSLANPDLMLLAQAYQQEGVQVESPAELREAVTKAFSRKKMTIIELKLKIKSTPFAKY